MAEVEFRDGTQEIPDYLRDLMLGLETHRFTFDEAVSLANKKLLNDRMMEGQVKLLKEHFRGKPF